MELFTIGNYSVSLTDVIVAVVCVLALTLFLVFIIKDIKKSNAKNASGDFAGETSKKTAVIDSAANNEKNSKADARRAKKAAKSAKKNSKNSERVHVEMDPVIKILGFDPYAPVETESCEITETYYDEAHETEDMRILRSKMRAAKDTESKMKTLAARRDKVNYELEKISRYVRDNKVVISTSKAASEKLGTELNALTADKKTAKENKQAVAKIKTELDGNVATVETLRGSVEKKEGEERLLKSALNYLESEIAKTDRELAFINSDVDRLNETVGAELKKIENDNRARTLMNKYGELKPLLTDANRIYREIAKADVELSNVHADKHDVKAKLDAAMNELKLSYGAQEVELTTRKIGELNRRLIVLDAKEEELIAAKEDKLARYAVAKRKANDFLDTEKYELADIIVAEDKVVGELEYEQVKADYEKRKSDAKAVYDAAQKKSDTLAGKKVKFGKKQQDQKRAYEDEVAAVSSELRAARADYEKAASDCDKILPSLSPTSLVESGSGVISKERLSKKAALDKSERDRMETDRARRIADSIVAEKTAVYTKREEPTFEVKRPLQAEARSANLPARPGNEELRRLMNRLNELERIALREKEQRAMMRGGDYAPSPMSKANKIERRKAQVVAMRKNLKYIDSPQSAKEFKQKLYRLSISLDEDEMSDNVLAEMIRRTMNEATVLGERAGRGNEPPKRY